MASLANLSRRAVALLRRASAVDSAVQGMVDTLDRQFAFYEMQGRGVESGRSAAIFLNKLLVDLQSVPHDHAALLDPELRIHLLGHSFGGLVVSNAARHLAVQFGHSLHTVCVIQGAIGSDWFARETVLRQRVKGVIGAIYSRYDTATGFIYPLANQARLAAGSVGLAAPAPLLFRGNHGEFASLPRPPHFDPPVGRGSVLNADGSRLIYEGPPIIAGGHDDIFKDDVVNLLWAITTV